MVGAKSRQEHGKLEPAFEQAVNLVSSIEEQLPAVDNGGTPPEL